MKKEKRKIKCQGRFSEFRNLLYDEAFPIVVEDRSLVEEKDLLNLWDLVKEDIYTKDFVDPYYGNKGDILRREPPQDHLSLAPLVESPTFHLETGLVEQYALERGNSIEVSKLLGRMADEHPERFFKEVLEKEPSNVVFAGGQDLGGYRIAGNFGIGTISPGGMAGGGVRSDSPFLLEISAPTDQRGQYNLAATVGFWVQDDEMIVSQMQSCKNARFPKGVPFGVGCLSVAIKAARAMGLEKVVTYAARTHPLFKEHPENWGQMGEDFVALYDNSSKKLGFDGGRRDCHKMVLRK